MNKEDKRGLLVAFEGIDGSGKSTQARMLYEWLLSKGYRAILLREPTDGIYGKLIRKKLRNGDASPEEIYKLFLLDRIEDVSKNILPALKRDVIVVIDRYFISTIAYQGASGIPIERILKDHQSNKIPFPDIVFILDLPVEEAINRLRRIKKEADIFEKADFLRKVRSIYLKVDKYIPCKVVVLDATKNVKEIHNIIVNFVSQIL